jgi:superfamily II DNA/RNA helicase
VFAADQTGTGKTFAYLLPILKILKDQEKTPGFKRRGQHARAVIMVPTRELVEQIVVCWSGKGKGGEEVREGKGRGW